MCSNCDTDVYVLHAMKDEGRTFVTKSLLVSAKLSCLLSLVWVGVNGWLRRLGVVVRKQLYV